MPHADLKQVRAVENALNMTLRQRQDFGRWLHKEKEHRWDRLGPNSRLPYDDLMQAGKDFLEESGESS